MNHRNVARSVGLSKYFNEVFYESLRYYIRIREKILNSLIPNFSISLNGFWFVNHIYHLFGVKFEDYYIIPAGQNLLRLYCFKFKCQN